MCHIHPFQKLLLHLLGEKSYSSSKSSPSDQATTRFDSMAGSWAVNGLFLIDPCYDACSVSKENHWPASSSHSWVFRPAACQEKSPDEPGIAEDVMRIVWMMVMLKRDFNKPSIQHSFVSWHQSNSDTMRMICALKGISPGLIQQISRRFTLSLMPTRRTSWSMITCTLQNI
mmetsp:Transcript_14460/g.29892  ORF Transcript_14460/g.29892 Transcript_14460/m.29892 type:complete len:172 (-) Transcript_14460:105-620(-)